MMGSDDDPGVVRRSLQRIFTDVPDNTVISLSYLEVYKETVRDLLNASSPPLLVFFNETVPSRPSPQICN
jgi:hypothetical protein